MKQSYALVNSITMWRILMAPLVLFLAFYHQLDLFKWFLAFSFLTDAVDGVLARRLKTTSTRGARLDSIGDDLTVAVAIAGMLVFKMDFVREENLPLLLLSGLFLLHTILAVAKYSRLTAFHTWSAKLAAVLQAVFFLLLFFRPAPSYPLFYAAVIATSLNLVEEIGMVILLDEWQADVRGLFQAWKISRH